VKVCATCGTEYPDDQKFCPKDGSALRSTAQGNLVGSVIADRYHIVKKLGEGGMGAVYLGEHVKMHRKSAIKVMSQGMANDPDAIARFNREAANAARITHPNVCAIYDFGETTDGVIYLAMEFIEGEALTDVIAREGALPPARAGRILAQTADALQAAHDLGIVHRDLKPDNIMIARARDGSDVVKVVDFGIAKAMGGEEGQKVTKTGLVVGTPEYMSPEQLSGDTLDGRSDIYSLAIVLYRMLTGVLPFQADSAQETMIKRLTDDPIPLNDARPGLSFPTRLQDVMDRALARMPGDRYASAAQFGSDVTEAVSGMVQAPIPDTEGATQIIDTTAATDVIPKTRVGAARAPTPDTPAPSVAVPAPTAARKKSPVIAIAAAAVIVVGGGTAFMLWRAHGTPPAPAQQSAAMAPDSSHAGNADTTVTGGTDAPVNRRDTGRAAIRPKPGPERQVTRDVTGNPGVGTPRGTESRPRTALVRHELDSLLDVTGDTTASPQQIEQVIPRAQAIYHDQSLPDSLRAYAASIVSSAFISTDRGLACTWITNAVNLNAKPSYLAVRTSLRCAQ